MNDGIESRIEQLSIDAEVTVLDEDHSAETEPVLTQKLEIKPAEAKRSKVAGTYFQRLAKTEDETSDIEKLLSVDKVFVIFTKAGKPVYSS